jgi:anti-anti-sigma regulatory factor/HAMP domain-containing protein
MTIRLKLILVLAVSAVVAAGGTSAFSYADARAAIESRAFDRLTAIREMKAEQIEAYFAQIRSQLVLMSEDPTTMAAARELRAAFHSALDGVEQTPEDTRAREQKLKRYYQEAFLARLAKAAKSPPAFDTYWPREETTRFLQQSYLSESEFEVGSKHLLDAAQDGSGYGSVHARFHPYFRAFLERFGYYDIFLIDPVTGHIVYSVFKEVDFATSLRSGPYRDSALGRAFTRARAEKAHDFAALEDFAPYAPSYLAPASFIASPIFDGETLVGVLAFQMPIDRINGVMTSGQRWHEVGMGESGETYIVGEDRTLRSESRFLLEDKEAYLRQIATSASTGSDGARRIDDVGSAIGLQRVETPGVTKGLLREENTEIFADYRGVPVLSSYRRLDIPGVRWVILSEIDEAEAFADAHRLRDNALISLAVLLIVAILVAVVFGRQLTHRLNKLTRRARAMADGDLDSPLDTTGADEITDLARSFDVMRRSVHELLEAQERSIDALATPMVPLTDEVVAMPLVGELDLPRVEKIRERLVDGLHGGSARVAVIDITGVPTMTADVAATLTRAALAARLVGARVILTGMQPEVAKTLSTLDVGLGAIETERNLQAALDLVDASTKGGHPAA